jgi:hypothetical protein
MRAMQQPAYQQPVYAMSTPGWRAAQPATAHIAVPQQVAVVHPSPTYSTATAYGTTIVTAPAQAGPPTIASQPVQLGPQVVTDADPAHGPRSAELPVVQPH